MNLSNCSDIETVTANVAHTIYKRRQAELITPEEIGVILLVNSVVLSGTICVLGIVFNVINIVVFLKQGLTNTVNISMFAIAVSDLCSLVTLEWVNINLNPFMEKADLPYEPSDITPISGGWPHAYFFQITSWVNVYVTAERFVCVALPLKVKQMFTPLRTKLAIGLIYLLVLLALSPALVIYYLGANFYPARNQTRIGIKERNIWKNQIKISYLTKAVMAFVSFIFLTMFTSLLVVALKRSSQWRNRNSKSMSRRESKTVKMVCVVSAFLVLCSTPVTCLSVAVFFVPGFVVGGEHTNILRVFWSFTFLPDAINSTSNIFFYYKMSSNYKKVIRDLLCRCKQHGHNISQF